MATVSIGIRSGASATSSKRTDRPLGWQPRPGAEHTVAGTTTLSPVLREGQWSFHILSSLDGTGRLERDSERLYLHAVV